MFQSKKTKRSKPDRRLRQSMAAVRDTMFCIPSDFVICQIGPTLNLSEKYPGYRVVDKNSREYQMEAFIYTCAILLFYTLTTGAFMVRFILQSREPWETVDHDGTGAHALSYVAHVAKVREREMHKRMVERLARRDVKLRMINHLNQIGAMSSSNENVGGIRVPQKTPPRSGSDGMISTTILQSDGQNGYKCRTPIQRRRQLRNDKGKSMMQRAGNSFLIPLLVPVTGRIRGKVEPIESTSMI